MTDNGPEPPHTDPPASEPNEADRVSEADRASKASVAEFKRRLAAASTDGERADALRDLVLELLERVSKDADDDGPAEG